MKIKMLCFLLIFQTGIAIQAQETYHVKSILPELLVQANAVKRMEEKVFEIKKLDETILKHKYAITILNEKGESHAALAMSYDKLHTIRSIEGTLYDAAGKQIRKLKSKDVMDISGVDDNNLIDDNRRKYFSFYHKVYPYTVEFETEEEYKNTLFFPLWLPQEDELYAVEKSKLTVISPEGYDFRYKAFQYKGQPLIQMDKGKKYSTWEVKNQPAIRYEVSQPHLFDIATAVLLGPTAFKIQNYEGNMTSWKEFGRFVHTLKQDKDELPDAIKSKVHQLTDALKSDNDKITSLYQFMQQHTRYVSIQLGIGGWQPYDAKFVGTKGYGDCKALTNYMYALLKEAGIKSYYTLIKAGRNSNDVISDFPSQQFNHVILCVPQKKDTVWLECTSQTMPAGYLGDFTANRYALLVDENGGTLIRTPRYGEKENLQIRKLQAQVKEDGTLQLKTNSVYKGIQQDNLHGFISTTSKDKIKEYLNQELEFSTYQVTSFDYHLKNEILPAIEENMDIQVSNYATVTGKRLFLVPNIMSRNHQKLSKDEERKYQLRIRYAFQDIDSVIIDLPVGYVAESLPQPVRLQSPYGTYSAEVRIKDNQLLYYRNYAHFSGTYAPTEYIALASFYESIYKADRTKVVLVKKSE
jgi:transglutaminase-like putative cysteine protease